MGVERRFSNAICISGGFILVVSFFVLSSSASAQSETEVVRLDYNISFTIPKNYHKLDTLDQTIYYVEANGARMEVTKVLQPEAQIRNVQELLAFYHAYQQTVVDRLQGQLVEQHDYNSNEQYTHYFKIETQLEGSVEIYASMLALIDRNLYSFSYSSYKRDGKKGKLGREAFFRGITIYNTSLQRQLTIRTANDLLGEKLNLILRYVLLATIVTGVVLWFLKIYSWVKRIKNVLAIGLLSWGFVNLLLFALNVLVHNSSGSILFTSALYVIVGFFLGWLKVPVREKDNR